MIRRIALTSALFLSTSLFAGKSVVKPTCKLFLLTSTEISAQEPLGGLHTWEQDFKDRFQALGYTVEEVHRDQMHNAVERGDLVLSTLISYEKRKRGIGIINSHCHVEATLEKVVANHGENAVDRNHIKTAWAEERSIRKTPHCSEAMKEVIKELPSCVHLSR